MPDEPFQIVPPLTLPWAGSLLFTWLVVEWRCTTPLENSLTLPQLAAKAIWYVLVAFAAHAFAVWCMYGGFRDHIEVPRKTLFLGLWLSLCWLPLLALLDAERSLWTVGLPLVVAALALRFLKNWKWSRWEPAEERPAKQLDLFNLEVQVPFWRRILPAVVAALALEAALAAALAGEYLLSGVLLAVGFGIALWLYPEKSRPSDQEAAGFCPNPLYPRRTMVSGTLASVLLTAAALLPFVKAGALPGWVNVWLKIHPIAAAAKTQEPNEVEESLGSYYSGVILFLPPKPAKEVLPPAPVSHLQVGRPKQRQTVIPFDGMYWYFQFPEERPKPNARVVRGEPQKVNVRSTNLLPLSMEAHQYLATPMPMDCCSTLQVELTNADNRPGAIYVEVVLKHAGKAGYSLSLGNLAIPSSEGSTIPPDRKPVHEALKFPIPPEAKGKVFDEIAVAIKPTRQRDHVGAHVAVEQFVLEP